MKKNNETTSIGDLLNSTIFGEIAKSDKMNVIIKQSTLFSFWEDIVGAKFAKFTKPVSIKGRKIYVSAKSPALIQELTLFKQKLIKKINSYALPLGIEIKDFVFDYKNYNNENETQDNFIEDKSIQISQEQINEVEIDSLTEAKIIENVSKIKFLNDEQKNVFSKKLINTYKVKHLQNKK